MHRVNSNSCIYTQESKAQLTATSKKLKQAKEEGEQIRADLKTMIKQYQVLQSSGAFNCVNIYYLGV